LLFVVEAETVDLKLQTPNLKLFDNNHLILPLPSYNYLGRGLGQLILPA